MRTLSPSRQVTCASRSRLLDKVSSTSTTRCARQIISHSTSQIPTRAAPSTPLPPPPLPPLKPCRILTPLQAEDKKKEEARGRGRGIAGMVIMPPAIKREIMWLRTTVSRAEYIPSVGGGIGGSGIDAQFTINHGSASNKKSTKAITCKGTDRAKLSPNFNYEIWLPVTVPTSSQTIKCTLEDVDPLSTNLVASSYFKWDIISALTNKKMGPFWQPLYGAAINLPEQVKLAVKASEAAGTAWTSYYNRYPESSSTYRGRVLLTHKFSARTRRSCLTARRSPRSARGGGRSRLRTSSRHRKTTCSLPLWCQAPSCPRRARWASPTSLPRTRR